MVDSLIHLLELGDLEISDTGWGYSIQSARRPLTMRRNEMPSPEAIDNHNAHDFHLFLKRERVGFWFPIEQWVLEDRDDHRHDVSNDDLLRLVEVCRDHVKGIRRSEKLGNEAAIYKRLQNRLDEIIGENP